VPYVMPTLWCTLIKNGVRVLRRQSLISLSQQTPI